MKQSLPYFGFIREPRALILGRVLSPWPLSEVALWERRASSSGATPALCVPFSSTSAATGQPQKPLKPFKMPALITSQPCLKTTRTPVTWGKDLCSPGRMRTGPVCLPSLSPVLRPCPHQPPALLSSPQSPGHPSHHAPSEVCLDANSPEGCPTKQPTSHPAALCPFRHSGLPSAGVRARAGTLLVSRCDSVAQKKPVNTH